MSDAIKQPRPGVRLARWIFGIAGVYGVIAMLSAYISPSPMSGDAPQTQPIFYYGFCGVVLTWQIVFLLIAADPIRYRPLMLIAAVGEKGLFVALAIGLMAADNLSLEWCLPVGIDAALGISFLFAFYQTRSSRHTIDAIQQA